MAVADPARAFLGVGWAFPPGFEDGRASVAAYEEDVRQAIRIILGTSPGERVMRPDFGAGLDRFVFEPISPTTLTRVGDTVRDALSPGSRASTSRTCASRPKGCRPTSSRSSWTTASGRRTRGRTSSIRSTSRKARRREPTDRSRARSAYARRPRCTGFVARLEALGPGYVPEWRPEQLGVEAAVTQIVARYLQSIARRLEQAPAKNELAFLDLLGVRLVPAQPARAPIVFELANDAADVAMPAGTRFAAPPPPGGGAQITFETERPIRLAAARLVEAVSLWPGRDQFIDHSAALAEGRPFQLFDSRALQDTPHHLYIAHERLLALAGESAVSVTFELTTGSSDSLDLRWEYWDGDVWRPFKDMRPACSNEEAAQLDSTGGLRTSGAYRLETDCAETAKTSRVGLRELLGPRPARRDAARRPRARAAGGRGDPAEHRDREVVLVDLAGHRSAPRRPITAIISNSADTTLLRGQGAGRSRGAARGRRGARRSRRPTGQHEPTKATRSSRCFRTRTTRSS